MIRELHFKNNSEQETLLKSSVFVTYKVGLDTVRTLLLSNVRPVRELIGGKVKVTEGTQCSSSSSSFVKRKTKADELNTDDPNAMGTNALKKLF